MDTKTTEQEFLMLTRLERTPIVSKRVWTPLTEHHYYPPLGVVDQQRSHQEQKTRHSQQVIWNPCVTVFFLPLSSVCG